MGMQFVVCASFLAFMIFSSHTSSSGPSDLFAPNVTLLSDIFTQRACISISYSLHCSTIPNSIAVPPAPTRDQLARTGAHKLITVVSDPTLPPYCAVLAQRTR